MKEFVKHILPKIELVFKILAIGFPFAWVVWYIITQDPSAEVKNILELMQAMAVASAALIGLTGIFLVEIARNEATLAQNLQNTLRDFRIARITLSWSIIIGLATLVLICFWFINENPNCLEFAWALFFIQLFSPIVALTATKLFTLH